MNNFEEKLISKLDYLKDSTVKDAMIYALSGKGKRVRPRLLYDALKGFNCDFNVDNIAVAIEMIHTYSLVHDDLPAMDDDILRRGRNTCHIQFDEAIAILAGDALLTEAFNLVSRANLKSEKLVKIVRLMADFSGANGMIYGQEIDIKSEGKDSDFETLKTIHKYKTGALISLPLQIACVVSKNDELIPKFKQIGYKLGLAFQIQDDILDVTFTSEELGKSNSDLENQKATSVSVLGLEKATKLMEDLYSDIKSELENIDGFNPDLLLKLIDELTERRK
ncbi:MAG: polyprenyl synthetase family protein [Bacillota bacterium]|jgi:geranylgeranyl pyrophosphate synthase|nr:polyprenyl synthetase family protein [Bacillota bacterium]NLP22659.1 polyprenyl synthetase family protein [Erysipelotrichaceae bacterium]